MITSVRIENFRCFKDARADDLGAINVVVGDNSAGKTSFLEALYLASTTTPQAHLKFFTWRGLRGRLEFEQTVLESGQFWADLFHLQDLSNPVRITAGGDVPREVRIWMDQQRSNGYMFEGGRRQAPVGFAWQVGDEEEEVVFPHYDGEGVYFPPVMGGGIHGAMLADAVHLGDTVKWFSALDTKGEIDRVLDIVRSEFDEIEDLSIGLAMSVPTLFAKLRHQDAKVPLQLVSHGVAWFIHILLAIANYGAGSVYIDEFARGLHHRRLPSVWKALVALSRSADAQVFLSTHSGDALAALGPVAAENEEAFRLVRVHRREGESLLQVSHGVNLAAALGTGVEVR